jgi:hypothetical protein
MSQSSAWVSSIAIVDGRLRIIGVLVFFVSFFSRFGPMNHGCPRLPSIASIRAARSAEDPEARRLWKKFQQVMALSEKDRRAVIRLVNSLVEAKSRLAHG